LDYNKDELNKLIDSYLGPSPASGTGAAKAELEKTGAAADSSSAPKEQAAEDGNLVDSLFTPGGGQDVSVTEKTPGTPGLVAHDAQKPAGQLKVPDAPRPSLWPQVPDTPKPSLHPKVPDAPRPPLWPQVPDAPKPPLHPERRQAPKPPGLQKTPKSAQSYDVSQDDSLINKPENEPDKNKDLDIGSPSFKINFDFDGKYPDVPEDKPIRRRREKRTGCVGGILYSAFIIVISIVLASLIWMATVDVLGFGAQDELVNISVHTDFTVDEIANILYETGLIKYKFLFIIYAEYSNAEEKISPGSYVLNKNFDYRALVQGMTARAGVRVETRVTIPEGFTMAQTFNLMEDYAVCSASDLWDTARTHNFTFSFLEGIPRGERLRLEGFLFPETYNFFIDSTPTQVLNRLLREFDRRFTEEMTERAEEMGYSVRDIINIASMIEREAGSDEERSRIAAVIYNRLDNWSIPLLQIDATITYAIAGTETPWSKELESLYNTYTHAGLPPGPIANPGMASILAALYPDSTNEYYYALNKSGTHNFFRTYEQHTAFVNGPDYGG